MVTTGGGHPDSQGRSEVEPLTGPDRVRAAIEHERGGRNAPRARLTLCGEPDGTERRVDSYTEHAARERRWRDVGPTGLRPKRGWWARLRGRSTYRG